MADSRPSLLMNVRIDEVMVPGVLTVEPERPIGEVRQLMIDNKIGCVPVAGPDGEPVGIVTNVDLLDHDRDDTPVREVMSDKVFTVPQYSDPSLAARTMRNQHIHHLVVTHEKKIVGVLSSFDLLRLLEDRRFVMKNPPSKNRKRGGGRWKGVERGD